MIYESKFDMYEYFMRQLEQNLSKPAKGNTRSNK